MTAGAAFARRWQEAQGQEAGREVLRDAAHEMIRIRGVDGLNMRALAAQVGTSAMAAYRYYASKDELVEVVRIEIRRRFGVCLESAAAGTADASERLVRMAQAYLRFAVENEQDYRLMFGSTSSPPMVVSPAGRDEALAWKVLLDALASLPGTGTDRPVLEQAHLVWATLHGLAMLHLSGRLLLGRSIDELEQPLARYILAALGVPGGSGRSACRSRPASRKG